MKSSNSKIRYAKPNHIDAIFEIEKKCFPDMIGYSKHELTYLILHPKNICLIETQDEVIRAFLIINYRNASLIGRIVTIDVEPSFQKQGMGLRLLKTAETDMRKEAYVGLN